MRIGIDFDNTIIDYGYLFYELALGEGWVSADRRLTKEQVKAHLVDTDGHDLKWQSLQAKAYGAQIFRAKPFDGFREFLSRAKAVGHEIFIVSQKSATSNYDPSVRLREAALQWIDKNGLTETVAGRTYFETTRAEKIERIKNLKLDLFIDDLREVLEDPAFPSETTRIWFRAAAEDRNSNETPFLVGESWWAVAKLCEVAAKISGVACEAFFKLTASLPLDVTPVGGTGNNQIFAMNWHKPNDVVLKRYFKSPSETRDRCRSEFQALKLLWANGFRNIPEPFYNDERSRFSFYSCIQGRPPTLSQISDGHILKAAEFLLKLQRLSHNLPETSEIGSGADSRSCLRDYLDILEKRITKIRSGCNESPLGDHARKFLDDELAPFYATVINAFETKRQIAGIDLSTPLKKEQMILSPSDFGFHNCIETPNGELVFIDFEYFGWDDPAKLFADFFHSVAFTVPWRQKWLLLETFTNGVESNYGKDFRRRWELVVDLIGVEWILIVLNIIDPATMQRKLFANKALRADTLVGDRLEKARAMLDQYKSYSTSKNSSFLTIRPE